jgi:hypothetical protein
MKKEKAKEWTDEDSVKWTKEQKTRKLKWDKAKKKCQDMVDLEDEAFKKWAPELQNRYDNEIPEKDKGHHGEFLVTGTNDTVLELVDNCNQMLMFRVGPVFYKDGEEVGLWINYQRRHMSADLMGPVLMSKKMWNTIKKEIDKRFAYKRRKG